MYSILRPLIAALRVDVVEVGLRAGGDLAVARRRDAGQREVAADRHGVLGDADVGGAGAAVAAAVVVASAGAAGGERRGRGDQAAQPDQPGRSLDPLTHCCAPSVMVAGSTGCCGVSRAGPVLVRCAVAVARRVLRRTTSRSAHAVQAGGGEQDHQHHHHAVDQRGELGRGDVVQARVAAPVGDTWRQEGQQGRAEQGARQAAEAAEHHRGEQREAERQGEASWGGEPDGEGEHRAGRAGGGGAHHEGRDARPPQVDAGQLGRHLVVAHRPPAPTHPAGREVGQQDVGEHQRGPGQEGDPPGVRQVLPVTKYAASRAQPGISGSTMRRPCSPPRVSLK